MHHFRSHNNLQLFIVLYMTTGCVWCVRKHCSLSERADVVFTAVIFLLVTKPLLSGPSEVQQVTICLTHRHDSGVTRDHNRVSDVIVGLVFITRKLARLKVVVTIQVSYTVLVRVSSSTLFIRTRSVIRVVRVVVQLKW